MGIEYSEGITDVAAFERTYDDFIKACATKLEFGIFVLKENNEHMEPVCVGKDKEFSFGDFLERREK
jgi:hypothetical protein